MIESHAHYDDTRFNGDRAELLSSLCSAGIELVINIGADMKSSRKSIEMAKEYPFIYAAVGVHPHDAQNMTDGDFEILKKYASYDKTVAIGEIGLDFYYDNSPREIQRRRFREQLALAKEMNLPVVIHSRDACAETFDIIKESGVREGVIHCYSGSAELAHEYVKMGFYIGVGGVVTYSNARKLVETVEALDVENILLETDCPYLSPVPHRGERNSSLNLTYIAKKIAELKKMPVEDVERITAHNTLAAFPRCIMPVKQ